jgi:hypothetical protein
MMAVVVTAGQYPTPPHPGQDKSQVHTSFRVAAQLMWTSPPFPSHISRLRELSGAGIISPGACPE